MNERIKELAEQSGISRQYQEEYFGPKLLEQFAELIVRECMAIGFNTVYKVDDDSAAVAVYQNIKEHFGVEE